MIKRTDSAAREAMLLGESMRRAVQQDQDAILEYLKKAVDECIYLYIDILNYGVASENIAVWLQEQDEQIELVVMKYFDSFQVYSHRRGIDVGPVLALLQEHPVTMVSARRDIIEQMEELCHGYCAVYGAVFDVSRLRRTFWAMDGAKREKPSALEVTEAVAEDAAEIAELICSDDTFRVNYKEDDLARQLAERIRTHTGRSVIIRMDGRIVAHDATFAEAEGVAVVSGLVIRSEYRGLGCYEAMVSYLGEQLMQEGKIPYAFAITDKTIRYHRAVYTECGEYGKLIKNEQEQK